MQKIGNPQFGQNLVIIRSDFGQMYCQIIFTINYIRVQTSITGCVGSTLFRSATTFQLSKRNFIYLSLSHHIVFSYAKDFPKSGCSAAAQFYDDDDLSINIFCIGIRNMIKFDPMTHHSQPEQSPSQTPISQMCVPMTQHKLQKMTRILMDEQIKTMNRIQIFKKTTAKMVNGRNKQIKVLKTKAGRLDPKHDFHFQIQAIEPIVNKPTVCRNLKSECSTRSQRSLRSAASSRSKQIIELAQHRRLSKKANEQLIAKQKYQDLRRNLKSAKLIRSARQNIKSAKQNYFEWKIGAVRESNQEIWQKDYNMYLERFKKIQKLKKMELEALAEWKRNKDEIDQIYQEAHAQQEQ